MLQFFATLQALITRKDDEGATMVEYGLMVALVAVVVALAVGPLGTAISTMFNGVTASL